MKTKLVTTIKHQATRSLAELHESKEPVLITEQGRPMVYLIDVDDYELMRSRMSMSQVVNSPKTQRKTHL